MEGIQPEFRCKKCARLLKPGMQICPECLTIVEPDFANEEYDITVDVDHRLGATHVREKVTVNYKTKAKQIIDTLIEKGIINNGGYLELGQIKGTHYAEEGLKLERFWCYRPGDTVFFQRIISETEKLTAYAEYIKAHYSEEDINKQYTIKVELRGVCRRSSLIVEPYDRVVYIGKPHRRKRRIIRVKLPGYAQKEDLYQLVRKMDWDVKETFVSWPKAGIPFEDGEICVDAIVCEIKREKVIMGPQTYP